MERQTRNMSHSLENQSPDGEMANLFSDEALLNPSTTEPTIAKLSPTSHSETLSTSQLEATSDPFVTTTNSSSTSHPETTNKAQLQALKSALKDLLFSQPSAQSSAHQYFQYQETRRDLAEKIRRLEATIRREEAAAKRDELLRSRPFMDAPPPEQPTPAPKPKLLPGELKPAEKAAQKRKMKELEKEDWDTEKKGKPKKMISKRGRRLTPREVALVEIGLEPEEDPTWADNYKSDYADAVAALAATKAEKAAKRKRKSKLVDGELEDAENGNGRRKSKGEDTEKARDDEKELTSKAFRKMIKKAKTGGTLFKKLKSQCKRFQVKDLEDDDEIEAQVEVDGRVSGETEAGKDSEVYEEWM